MDPKEYRETQFQKNTANLLIALWVYRLYKAVRTVQFSYTSTPPMGRSLVQSRSPRRVQLYFNIPYEPYELYSTWVSVQHRI